MRPGLLGILADEALALVVGQERVEVGGEGGGGGGRHRPIVRSDRPPLRFNN